MARPRSERWVQTGIASCAFVPAGVPARELAHVTIGLDEMEAIRLADLEGLYQETAARRMGVSRQTFGRIVESARHKVADAIINRKCLRVAGDGSCVEYEKDEGTRGTGGRHVGLE